MEAVGRWMIHIPLKGLLTKDWFFSKSFVLCIMNKKVRCFAYCSLEVLHKGDINISYTWISISYLPVCLAYNKSKQTRWGERIGKPDSLPFGHNPKRTRASPPTAPEPSACSWCLQQITCHHQPCLSLNTLTCVLDLKGHSLINNEIKYMHVYLSPNNLICQSNRHLTFQPRGWIDDLVTGTGRF